MERGGREHPAMGIDRVLQCIKSLLSNPPSPFFQSDIACVYVFIRMCYGFVCSTCVCMACARPKVNETVSLLYGSLESKDNPLMEERGASAME